ncbi:mucin-5B [Frankliniella occidentalis]|uniref:Mucin-5B n=1 Tax=Frankliniella occidentalis TaxID=133901 RepID=A0A6J1SJH0_FRAOC|nr:mucin-5B [Frankliniella occidentalis]
MYSLYRSWLSRPDMHHPGPHGVHGVPHGLPHGVPLPSALPLADVVVAVGDGTHRYAAHRAVLAAHSGYFKSALDRDPGSAYLAVSSVTPEALVPLLGYMYTGYLDIGGDNIYDVLLAAGYLHMPRAVEWCRNFLLAHQPAALDNAGTTARSTLVKPIPGLPWRPALGAPPAPPQPPATHMILPTAEHSPFRAPFLAPSPTAVVTLGSAPKRGRSPSPSSSAGSPAKRLSGEDKERSKQATTVKCDHRSPSTLLAERSPEPSSTLTSTTSSSSSSSTAPTPSKTTASTSAPSSSSTTTATTTVVTGKVVVDVACCDGPVRFHRVLNTSYGHEDADQGATDSGEASDENQLHQRMHVPGAAQLRRARRMAERGPHTDVNTTADGVAAATTTNEYVCHYCNHTFKSHYCYQKHARRHINPLTPGAKLTEVQAPPAAARAPAKPLDMNVQYYPCKTCGAKFPSYYFVHKHRKLCHSGEEGDAAAGREALDKD